VLDYPLELRWDFGKELRTHIFRNDAMMQLQSEGGVFAHRRHFHSVEERRRDTSSTWVTCFGRSQNEIIGIVVAIYFFDNVGIATISSALVIIYHMFNFHTILLR
jgi:hypothetical protein